MKKISLFAIAIAFGTVTFAQNQICPTSFRRNNGNGQCPSGQLIFTFATCPNPALTIDSIYRGGVKLDITITSSSCSAGKVEYCLSGGNLAPAGSLLVFFSQQGVNGTTYTNCFVPEQGPLPVVLSSFNAVRNGNNVNLSWKTETEAGAKQFVIQRMTGNEFTDVAKVDASNNINGSAYTFTDNNPLKVVSQYRLKMVDMDGTYKNSDIKAVKGLNGASEFTVFPNPSMGSAKVTISDVTDATDVQVIDQAGRVIKNITRVNGTVDLTNLQKGMYLIRVVNKKSGDSNTQKLSVIN